MDLAQAQAMVATMADMQEHHNRNVHPLWRDQDYAYYRAVWVECAELLDHFGWKWWKLQRPDLDQVKLEIVDIWHFGLSDLMRGGALDGSVAEMLHATASAPDGAPSAGGEAFRLAVEELAASTLGGRRFAMEPFVAVLSSLPLPLDELFRMYVGKNVLNNFRQEHGYKTGQYRKLWQGREDNEHLVELLMALDCPPEEMPLRLYDHLSDRYAAS